MNQPAQPVAFATPAADVAERIARRYGETATTITLKASELIGKDDVEEFFRTVEESRESSRDAKLVLQ